MTPNLDHRTRLPLTNASPSSGLAPGGSPAATLDSAVRRARRRLLPFLLLMYVISFLDRANIGFAKEALQRYAGISPKAYALAAGLFFLSYAAFELPSNLILHRVGARVWMARIMVTWGLVSVATMLVKGSSSFYILRLLSGRHSLFDLLVPFRCASPNLRHLLFRSATGFHLRRPHLGPSVANASHPFTPELAVDVSRRRSLGCRRRNLVLLVPRQSPRRRLLAECVRTASTHRRATRREKSGRFA
jgi:hypothetical protein